MLFPEMPFRSFRWQPLATAEKVCIVVGAILFLPIAVTAGVIAGLAGELLGGTLAGDAGAMIGTMFSFLGVTAVISFIGLRLSVRIGRAIVRASPESE